MRVRSWTVAQNGGRWPPRVWASVGLGLAGGVAVVVGASSGTPDGAMSVPGGWLFEPRVRVSVAAVGVCWIGLAALLAAWWSLARWPLPGGLRRRGWVLAAWVAPFAVAPPLLSRDAYTDAAQGVLVQHGVNPYLYGPWVVPSRLVDPAWANSPSNHGPLALELFRGATMVSASASGAVVGLRLLAVCGVVLLALAVGPLARSFGADPSRAFVLAALNPLVLVCLVGGVHSDALVLGLLVAGLAVGRTRSPLAGMLVCAVAGCMALPAFLGAATLAWGWAAETTGANRVRRLALSALTVSAVVTLSSWATGLGWGWIGRASGVHPPGLGSPLGGTWHAAGLIVWAVLAVGLLWGQQRLGPATALGWTLVALAVLGMLEQPWFVAWGVVILAVSPRRLDRRSVMVLAVAATVVPWIMATTSRAFGNVELVACACVALFVGVVAVRGIGSAAATGRPDDPRTPLDDRGRPDARITHLSADRLLRRR